MLSARELNLRNLRPRITNPLAIHHLNNLRELLALFIKRQHEHVFVLIRATMMVRSHRAVQPRSAFFCCGKVVMRCYLRQIVSFIRAVEDFE